MNLQDNKSVGQLTHLADPLSMQRIIEPNNTTNTNYADTQSQKTLYPPNSYIKCIQEIQGNFIHLSINQQKVLNFYLHTIQSLFKQNYLLNKSLKTLQALNQSSLTTIYDTRNLYKDKYPTNTCEHIDSKKKRKRRKAKQIKRLYTCSVVSCQKNYGSEGALAHHMKIKHPQVQSPTYIPNSIIVSNLDNSMHVLQFQDSEEDDADSYSRSDKAMESL